MDGADRTITLKIIESQELPVSVHGVSSPLSPRDPRCDEYLILLNAADSEDRKSEAFVHEMLHIWNRDHFTDSAVSHVEALRHNEAMT